MEQKQRTENEKTPVDQKEDVLADDDKTNNAETPYYFLTRLILLVYFLTMLLNISL